MASPPVDPVVHLPADDAYLISGQDMVILREALRLKSRNKGLEEEVVSLRQLLEACDGG
jgi:hypothetical protein